MQKSWTFYTLVSWTFKPLASAVSSVYLPKGNVLTPMMDMAVTIYNYPRVKHINARVAIVTVHTVERIVSNLVPGKDIEPPLGKYIEMFTRTSLQLQKLISPAMCQGQFPYHYGITGKQPFFMSQYNHARAQLVYVDSKCALKLLNQNMVYIVNAILKNVLQRNCFHFYNITNVFQN